MTATGCANQPLLLSWHGIWRYFFLPQPYFGTEEGVFRLKLGNSDIVRLVGRLDRLGCA